MILVFGGTSETVRVVDALAANGHSVLVSTASDAPLYVGSHPSVERRCGRMDTAAMQVLIETRGVTAVVDVSHPYATVLHQSARSAAEAADIPYHCWVRPGMTETGRHFAADHAEAAGIAFGYGKPVLLTSGSRHLKEYVSLARQTGIPLCARVLDHPDARASCADAGLREDEIVFGRGPFSTHENRGLIRSRHIGVLVTKDSGLAGGIAEKLEAASLESCEVVMVGRPDDGAPTSETLEEWIGHLLTNTENK